MAEVRRGAKINPDGLELNERVVQVNRVAKVVKGGRRFSFSALVVVGNEVDTVGVGHGKAKEVPVAIQKAVEDAKKNLFRVPKYRTTITHQVTGRSGAGKVFMKPASEGTGVIAGGGVRAVLELAGIRDILTKSLGTSNPVNLVAATVAGPKALRRPQEVAALREKTASRPPLLAETLNPGLPASVAAVLRFVLAKDPGSRYLRAGEFAAALRQAPIRANSAPGAWSATAQPVMVETRPASRPRQQARLGRPCY